MEATLEGVAVVHLIDLAVDALDELTIPLTSG